MHSILYSILIYVQRQIKGGENNFPNPLQLTKILISAQKKNEMWARKKASLSANAPACVAAGG